MTAKELAFVGSAWIITAGLTYIGIKAYNDHASNQLKLSDKINNYLPSSEDTSDSKEYEIVISLDDLKKMGGEALLSQATMAEDPVVECDAQVIQPKEPSIKDTLKAFRKIITE